VASSFSGRYNGMDVLYLKQHLNKAGTTPWWEQISGAFADTPACEEAVALGRQYREAQHPPAEMHAHAERMTLVPDYQE